jgi:hypothetical protein
MNVCGMKHSCEVGSTLCMKILDWRLHISYCNGAHLGRLVSPIGWYLHLLESVVS